MTDLVLRNPGRPFAPQAIAAIEIDGGAIDRRIAELSELPPPDDGEGAALLIRAVGCIDLTTLQGDDTPDRVRALCARALAPLPDRADVRVAAVCVYHAMIAPARAALGDSGLPVAAVSAGFPAGLSPLSTRIAEVGLSVAEGAAEIDIVIQRRHALTGDWRSLYDEVCAFREAAGEAHVKAILATGELVDPTIIARAAQVCMMAGADFIKTSTGMEKVNATLPAGLVMMRAIRDYAAATGIRIGFKPAGGIATADVAIAWMRLLQAELGDGWLRPDLFRFGASRLLDDIQHRLAMVGCS